MKIKFRILVEFGILFLGQTQPHRLLERHFYPRIPRGIKRRTPRACPCVRKTKCTRAASDSIQGTDRSGFLAALRVAHTLKRHKNSDGQLSFFSRDSSLYPFAQAKRMLWLYGLSCCG
jgi:hypothetical protein